MTFVAELRDIDGHLLSRAPVKFTWTAVSGSSAIARKEPTEGNPHVTVVASAVNADNQQLFGHFFDGTKRKGCVTEAQADQTRIFGPKGKQAEKTNSDGAWVQRTRAATRFLCQRRYSMGIK